MSVTVTVLQPDPTVPLDRFTGWLREAGMTVETVELWQHPVPTVEEIGDGVIVLGGRDNCLTGYAWMPQLHMLLRQLDEGGTPVLGICLGHQILADAYGGTVELGLEGEEGAYEITLTEAGQQDPILGALLGGSAQTTANSSGCSFMAAESHHDVVTALPEGASLLASSQRYPNQAFRLGSAVGVQFHPEASPELVAYWTEGDGNDPAPVLADMQSHDAAVAAAGRAIAQAFAHECTVSALGLAASVGSEI